MTTTIKYYVSSASTGSSVLEFGKLIDGYDVNGQEFIVSGSNNSDYVSTGAGLSVDVSNLYSGTDTILFSGSWSDYTKDMATYPGYILFTRTVDDVAESILVSNGGSASGRDYLVFTDGTVRTDHARVALAQTAMAATTSDIGENWDTSTTSTDTSTVLPSSTSAEVNAYASGGDGAVFAPTTAGVKLNASGSNGVDKVYVSAGSSVDASNLYSGTDIIYLTGKWSDYTKDMATYPGYILFTRTVDGVEESVVVSNGGSASGRDNLVFADGMVRTDHARIALAQTAMAATISDIGENWDPDTTTPGLGWSPTSLTVLNNSSEAVDAVYGDGTYNFQVALPADDMDATTGEIAAWASLADGSRPVATFNINGTEVTGQLASTDGYNLIFSVTLPTNIADGTSIKLVSIDPGSATDMTVGGRSIKDELEIAASGTTVDNGDPEFTSNDAFDVAENSTGIVATVATSDTVGVTYSLGGTDASLFSINNQGQISVVDGTDLDFEGSQNSYSVTVTATDEFGNSAEQTIAIDLTNVNEAPTATSIDAMSAVNGQEFSGSISSYFTDVDAGDSLTFTATGLPDGLSIASNGTISGTPTAADNATVTITATDSGGLTVTQTVELSVVEPLALSTKVDEVTNLDVRSNLVVEGSENLSLTDQAGTYTITLTDGTTSGYEGDNTNNTQTISIVIGSDGSVSSVSTSGDNGTTSKTISDISDVLTISGSKVTINPAYDLDLGSDYTLSISDGLLVGSASGTSASLSASFSTVDPSTSGVVASTMGTDGTMTNGATWVDISRQGTVQPESVTNLDASAGEVVFVFQDSDTAAGVVDDSSGIKASAEFNVSIGNFGYDDLIYIDDIQNASGNDNLVSNGGFNGGDGTGTTPFTYNFIATAGSGSAKFALVLADDVTPFDLGAAGYVTNVETVADQIGFDNGMVISA